MRNQLNSEARVRALAVKLIIEGRVDEALKLLSKHYGIAAPKVRVGMPKGFKGIPACYDPARKLIRVRSSREYRNPLIILHEFYHHLRIFLGRHRGCEVRADEYALKSLQYYLILTSDESAID